MSKIFIWLGLGAVVLLAGFFAFNSFIYQAKQNSTDESAEPYRATLSGEYVCLPPVDQNGPHTLECAFGIRTESGEYFAVDFSLMSQTAPALQAGDRFSADGLVTPIERISTNMWQKYDIEGIFSVTDSVRVGSNSTGGDPEPVFCTMDAKMCPDGSYVGRQGPNCEFAACPGETRSPAQPVACTMEAKICPDGSAVGRKGPNCEFAACPGESY